MDADEPLNAPVVALLHRIREIAGRQLTAGPVVGEALAADAFPGAGVITAIAALHIFCLVGALLLAGWTHRSGSHPFCWFSVGFSPMGLVVP